MSLTNSSLPIVSANDTSTYYMSMLPVTSGQTSQEYVNPKITFNPQTNQFLINNQLNLGFTSGSTKPTNPEVGDKWYDTSLDITFQYVYDGLTYNWIDISGSTIPTNIYPKRSFSITANNGVINETATGLGILNNVTTFAVTTSNIPDDTPLTWINTGTAGAERFLDGLNSGTVNIKNNTGTIIRQATPSGRLYSNNYMQLSLYNNLDGGQLTQVANSDITYINTVVPVSYLIVAGGGGGSEYGGGGAGGVATGATTLKSGINYAITVGSGGAGNLPLTPPNPTWSSYGANGSNSSISASGFTSIVAVGGGRGGWPGGSGGGGNTGVGCIGGGVATQPSQNPGIPGVTNLGNPGGPKNSCQTGGGGGGAGGAGVPVCRPCTTKGGQGGAGYTWPFTANTYAGGGGGSAGASPGAQYIGGPGGTGGGGSGATPSISTSGTPGTNGLGGGGGGAGGTPGSIRGAGGTGGNGTIIIAMPTGYYSPSFGLDANTVTTPPAAPGMTVLTYTSNSALNLGCGAPGQPYSVNYLAVAGGGGGGGSNRGNQSAPGGGAGGLLTGTVKLTAGQIYTIQVGGGGFGGGGICGPGGSNLNPGFAGNNSIISGSGINTITAIGGGGGGSAMMACGTPGIQPQFGGSGGGGFGPPKAGANAGVAFGSTGFANTGTQGWPGGSQAFGAPNFQSMGLGTSSGGGGAGGKGGNSFGNNGTAQGGNGTGGGGDGYTWPYTANTYAGGGGGGSFNIAPLPRPASVYGLGGTGGGGRGGTGPCGLTLTANGVNNTGGGGGGAGLCFPNYFGANGGTGIVVIAMPSGAYTGVSAPGAFVSNPPAAPGLTVLTFNGNTTNRNANVTYTFTA